MRGNAGPVHSDWPTENLSPDLLCRGAGGAIADELAAVLTILIAGLAAVFATILIQRRIEIDLRRPHHDVGSVVFLQLGVVFAVLAFIFSEAWGQYNEAAQSIDLEVSAMHGVGMVATTLRPAQASTILAAERA